MVGREKHEKQLTQMALLIRNFFLIRRSLKKN